MNESTKRSVTTAQGVAALVGITLGVIPLVGVLIGRGPGLWTRLVGDTGSAVWWLPGVVVVACVVAIAVLERSARR